MSQLAHLNPAAPDLQFALVMPAVTAAEEVQPPEPRHAPTASTAEPIVPNRGIDGALAPAIGRELRQEFSLRVPLGRGEAPIGIDAGLVITRAVPGLEPNQCALFFDLLGATPRLQGTAGPASRLMVLLRGAGGVQVSAPVPRVLYVEPGCPGKLGWYARYEQAAEMPGNDKALPYFVLTYRDGAPRELTFHLFEAKPFTFLGGARISF